MLLRPQLRFDQCIDHFLRPFRALFHIAAVHHRHAAGVITPHVGGKTQDFTDTELLGRGVERLGDDESGNAVRRQGRRHVRWRHDHQFHLFGCGGCLLGDFEAVFAQQILQYHIVNRVPERNRHGFAAEVFDAVDARSNGQGRTRHVVPHQNFEWALTAIARPNGHRREQMHQVHLAADKRFDQLRPTAEHFWRFYRHAFGLE